MKAKILLSHRARRLFIIIHLWLGLFLGGWFSLIGVTGSVLAWRDELGALELRNRFPVEQPANATMLSLGEATAALKKSHPDLDVGQIGSVTVPHSRAPFYNFSVGQDRRRAMSVIVHPYSGKELGMVAPRTGTVATIQQFHVRLLGGIRSYVFNGFMTLMALPLLLSGLWLWWPRNAEQLKARTRVKSGASLKRKLYDLHNVMGIYLYGILFATTLTGVLLVVNHIKRDGVAQTLQELREGEAPQGRERQGREGRNRSEGRSARNRNASTRIARTRNEARAGNDEPTVIPGTTPPLSNDQLLEAARQAVPQYEITRLQLPQKPQQALRASYVVSGGFAINQSVFVNPYTGKIIPNENGGVGYNEVVRGLHFGNFAGIPVKLLYTVAGLLPLGLFTTGLWMWLMKKRRSRRSSTTELVEEDVLIAA